MISLAVYLALVPYPPEDLIFEPAFVLIFADQELESKDEHGQTPLSKAVENGHKVVVKLLLNKGAKLGSKDEHS